jgi:hypothetical protein
MMIRLNFITCIRINLQFRVQVLSKDSLHCYAANAFRRTDCVKADHGVIEMSFSKAFPACELAGHSVEISYPCGLGKVSELRHTYRLGVQREPARAGAEANGSLRASSNSLERDQVKRQLPMREFRCIPAVNFPEDSGGEGAIEIANRAACAVFEERRISRFESQLAKCRESSSEKLKSFQPQKKSTKPDCSSINQYILDWASASTLGLFVGKTCLSNGGVALSERLIRCSIPTSTLIECGGG